jgi:hypothetical protein
VLDGVNYTGEMDGMRADATDQHAGPIPIAAPGCNQNERSPDAMASGSQSQSATVVAFVPCILASLVSVRIPLQTFLPRVFFFPRPPLLGQLLAT